MKTRVVLAVVLLTAIAAVAAMYYRANRTQDEPLVTTAPVTRGDVVETVDATGTLQAVTTVQVGTQVSGTIKALHADFNSQVRRGQVIAELEPSLFETQVEQARASIVRLQAEARRAAVQRDTAQQQLKRARELYGQQLIAAMDLEDAEATARQAAASVEAAEAQIVQARASLNQSEVNLGHTIIRAPIDGIVISRNVDVGQTVAASMQAPTLFVIAKDLAEMQVNASVAESDIGRIAPGQFVSFRVDAYPGEAFTGTVSLVRLDPVVEQNVVSYVTTIDVPNPEKKLKPGMTANVTIEVERATNVLRVPNAALRVRPSAEVFAIIDHPAPEACDEPIDEAGVRHADLWIVREVWLERVPVRVGTTDATHTSILAGPVVEGDKVVTSITATAAAAPATASSPLLPSRPQAGRGASPSRTR